MLKLNSFLLIYPLTLFLFSPLNLKAESDPTETNLASPFQRVPDEFFVAEIPELNNFGPFFVSWGFVRPPQLWLQEKTYNLNDFKFPQWNSDQFPFTLTPSLGYTASLQFYDDHKKPIEQLPLEQPFPLINPKLTYLKDQVKSLSQSPITPTFFQVILESQPPRVKIQTELLPWTPPKEVFTCEIEILKEENLEKNKRFNVCLKTLINLPQNTTDQWYVWIQAPYGLAKESSQYASSKIREVGSAFKKSNNFFMSQRGRTRHFIAKAGVTRLKNLVNPTFDFSLIKNAEYLQLPPSREIKEQSAHHQNFENGASFEIRSYASDASEDREKNLNQSPNIQIQFIPSTQGELKLRRTDFKETRTGLAGFLRPWRVGLFTSYNFLTSNRGEKDQLLNFLGADLSYKLNYKGFDPHLVFESGLWHPGSNLSISEIDLGVSKIFIPSFPWLKFSAGYHNYTLSGRNPGSNRLGRMDSISLGALAQTKIDDRILRGYFKLLAASPIGFDARIETGKIYQGLTDAAQYLGYYLGYSRYAGSIQIKSTLVTENFSEERISFGIIWGYVGPESY